MKIESRFKICRQVNKIYTAYEVLLVDIKLTLCSFLLISALCHSYSNLLSFCSWFVATSADHTSICVQDALCPVPFPYSFVYSPITLRNSRHISCSAIQLLQIYINSLHLITVSLLFIFCLKGDTSEQRSLEDQQEEIDMEFGI